MQTLAAPTFQPTSRAHCSLLPFVAILILFLALKPQACDAQPDFDREPIHYNAPATRNPVARLQQQLKHGKVKLNYDEQFGYLKSVLKALKISHESQMLVFSKTSMQQRLISPSSPRALYFNDSTYVGWVPRGRVIEISVTDPDKGTVFYTLHQEKVQQPELIRSQGNCLLCHASSRTRGIPGHLVRSVYPGSDGMPHFGMGTFRTTHASPLKERWGGWYVTGAHGKQRHMGNEVANRRGYRESLNVEKGANVTELKDRLRVSKYLTKHSDIVALMVLEHQTEMHNLLTFASFDTRSALHYNSTMNRALKRPKGTVSESTQRRMNSAADRVVKYLLFAEEAPLTDTIKGTSGFTEEFERLGPKDSRGRSLRQFDLKRRLFRYPCSYLIYSDAFRELPRQVKALVYRKLWMVLTGREDSKVYANLSASDRKAIYEILSETHQDLPEYWSMKKGRKPQP